MNSHPKKHYVGLRLLWLSNGARGWEALRVDYVVRAANRAEMFREAKRLGKLGENNFNYDEKGTRVYTNQYLGVRRTFYVSGPLCTGALLGYHTFAGIRTLREAQKEPRNLKAIQSSVRRCWREEGPTDYIVSLCYLISGAGVPVSARKMVYASALIRGSNPAEIVQLAQEAAISGRFLKKLLRAFEGRLETSDLLFLGIMDAIPTTTPKVSLGQPFDAKSRPLPSPSRVRRLLPNQSKLLFPVFR